MNKKKVLYIGGAVVAIITVLLLTYYAWPVSESRWKHATLVMKNRFSYSMKMGGRHLYFRVYNPAEGIRGMSFNPDDCQHTQLDLGYISSPFGAVKGNATLMQKDIDVEALQDSTEQIISLTMAYLEQREEAYKHQMKEMDYYDKTHFKDDDGFLEMKQLRQELNNQKATLDSLADFMEKAMQHPGKVEWCYNYNVSALYASPTGMLELACEGVNYDEDSFSCKLTDGCPDEASFISNAWFDLTDIALNPDSVNRSEIDSVHPYVGMLRLTDGSIYTGELKGVVPHGTGVCRYADNHIYQGKWNNGQPEGHGSYVAGKSWFTGVFQSNNMLDGRAFFANGDYYEGTFLNDTVPDGAGDYYYANGSIYWGTWEGGIRQGFGMFSNAEGVAMCGIWKKDEFQGERLLYSEDRVYGIDIARYQHLTRKKQPCNIAWKYLRISSLGRYTRKRIKEETVDYPVSFVFIKCTEGVTVFNSYYEEDSKQIRELGLPIGSYHFFSSMPAKEQLDWFIQHADIRKGDLPPVLDLEPTDKYIKQRWGTDEKMFQEVLYWLKGVEKHFGVKPLLYVNQGFIKHHLSKASQELQDYDLWVARYGEFKPYAHMYFWQLACDGYVSGIQDEVDINVFNGSKEHFQEYLQSLR